jgi:hypothetical protein
MIRRVVSCVLAVLSALPAVARGGDGRRGEVYYVCPNGSDEHAGTSEARAWRSLERVNRAALDEGDVVLLRRGGIWRGLLAPRSDGITVGAFGEGAMPVISGAEPVDGLVRAGQGRWTARWARAPVQVFIDDRRGRRMSSSDAVATGGQWHWEARTSTLTVAAEDANGLPVVEATVRDRCVDLGKRRGITLRELHVRRAGFSGIGANQADGFTIEQCRIDGCYVAGIRASERWNRTGVAIRDNRVSDCGGTGIAFGGRLDDWTIERNVVEACGVLTEHVPGPGDGRTRAFQWTAGIKIWGWGGERWQGRYTIRHNVVRDCRPASWAPKPTARHGHGIWCDEVLEPTARPRVYGNRVHDCHSRGVYIEKTDDHDVFGNVVYRCAAARFSAAIEAQSNRFGYDIRRDRADDNVPRRVGGNRIYHNTVFGGWWQLAVHCSSKGCSISQTEVRANVCGSDKRGRVSLYFHGGGANDGEHGSGNVYRSNGFGPEGGSWVWGGKLYRTVEALQAASDGAISETVAGEARFVDPGSGEFRLGRGSPCIGRGESGVDLGAWGLKADLRPAGVGGARRGPR